MNGKKAKQLRRLAKAHGHYNNEAEYKVKETKKVVYYTDKDGSQKATQVSRYTIINPGKIIYRRMKAAYKNGELSV
jgi:hypothetical protein